MVDNARRSADFVVARNELSVVVDDGRRYVGLFDRERASPMKDDPRADWAERLESLGPMPSATTIGRVALCSRGSTMMTRVAWNLTVGTLDA